MKRISLIVAVAVVAVWWASPPAIADLFNVGGTVESPPSSGTYVGGWCIPETTTYVDPGNPGNSQTLLSGYTGLIDQGRGTGNPWSGTSGITSSMAANDYVTYSNEYSGVGIALNADLKALTSTSYTTWGNTSVSDADLLIKYTYVGDLNLDGKLDVTDYIMQANEWGHPGGGWVYGDVNYDGNVDVTDYLMLTNAWGAPVHPAADTFVSSFGGSSSRALAVASAGSLGSGTSAVPEPGTLGLLGAAIAVGAIGLINRCRRRP